MDNWQQLSDLIEKIMTDVENKYCNVPREPDIITVPTQQENI